MLKKYITTLFGFAEAFRLFPICKFNRGTSLSVSSRSCGNATLRRSCSTQAACHNSGNRPAVWFPCYIAVKNSEPDRENTKGISHDSASSAPEVTTLTLFN
jgi:hypothetical protein